VLAQIDECEHILSSSLHGLICAQALGIKSRWILLSNNVLGDGFKFRDYASSMDTTITPKEIYGDQTIKNLIAMTEPPPDKIEETKYNLNKTFESFIKNHRN